MITYDVFQYDGGYGVMISGSKAVLIKLEGRFIKEVARTSIIPKTARKFEELTQINNINVQLVIQSIWVAYGKLPLIQGTF